MVNSSETEPAYREESQMTKDEKAFQNYFMKLAKPLNYYRTSLTSGGGFPDVLGIHGEYHSFVELKDMILGKTKDHLLKQFFEPSQPPWYMDYFFNGGKRLFVAWRIRSNQESGKWYGLLRLTPELVLSIVKNELKYSHIKYTDDYEEFDTCIDMIREIEQWSR